MVEVPDGLLNRGVDSDESRMSGRAAIPGHPGRERTPMMMMNLVSRGLPIPDPAILD
jgi:hypothetical protein